MVEGLVKGKFKGVMADHEVERFRIWEGMGEEMVVSPSCSCLVWLKQSVNCGVRPTARCAL
jgi:hypothetical protein